MTVPGTTTPQQQKDEPVALKEHSMENLNKESIKKKTTHTKHYSNNNNSYHHNHSSNNNKYREDYNTSRYYNPKMDYSMSYLYYYPPNTMYYPAAEDATANSVSSTRDDEDLEIIVHDESMNNTSSSDQNKPLDLKRQLEFYFSRQNLVNDTFLVSQMDSDLYVPISLVAGFKRVREWTTDLDLIVNTLRESTSVTVDESGTKVKPNISVKRNTVILRDVPDCTEEEIVDLLKELNSPPVQSIKQDIGNMWYFTFESEDDALKLLLSVRGKSFKDQAIAARMKSEPFLRVQPRSTATTTTTNIPSYEASASPDIKTQDDSVATYHLNEQPLSTEMPPYPYGYYYPPPMYSNTYNSKGGYPGRGYYQQSSMRLYPNRNGEGGYQNKKAYEGQRNASVGGRPTRGGHKPRYNNNRNSQPSSPATDNVSDEGQAETASSSSSFTNKPKYHHNQQQQYNHYQKPHNIQSTSYNNNHKQYQNNRNNYKSNPNTHHQGNNNNNNTRHQGSDALKGSNTVHNGPLPRKSSNNDEKMKKKGRPSNSNYNNYQGNSGNHNATSSRQYHAGGDKTDGKKKRGSRSTTTTTTTTTEQNDSGQKVQEELKPAHFPPLPNQQEQTETAPTAPAPAPAVVVADDEVKQARSVADIVKSNVAVVPKNKKVEVKEQEQDKEAFPSLGGVNEHSNSKLNSFSYADMLKKKEKDSVEKKDHQSSP